MFFPSFSRAVTAHNSLCFPNEKNSPTCPLLGSLGNHTQTWITSWCKHLSQQHFFFFPSIPRADCRDILCQPVRRARRASTGSFQCRRTGPGRLWQSTFCGWRWFSITRRLLPAITCPCGLIKKLTENPRSTAFNNIIVSR